MSAEQSKKQVAPAAVERFVKQLNITFRAVKLYPLTSEIPRESARAAVAVLREILKRDPEVKLEVSKEGLLYDSLPVHAGHAAFQAFALEYYNRGISEVRFHAAVTEDEVVRFLSLLDVPPKELASAGGVEGHLWELQVDNITVQETKTRVVDAVTSDDEGESWPPDAGLLDEVLSQPIGRRPRAQRILVRLMGDRPALSQFLATPSSVYATGDTSRVVAQRIGALARSVRAENPVERARLYADLARSLDDIDPGVLREVLGQLLEESRSDEPVAAVVRAVALEQLCKDLVAELAFSDMARDELIRTIRNLVALGMAPRAETTAAFGQAMIDAGASAEYVDGVIEGAMPSRLQVRERPTGSSGKPVDVVLRLLDLAATNAAAGAQDASEVERIADEARRGITDADVLGALATLVSVEDRSEPLAQMLGMLENNLSLLVERQDFDVAADAAETLMQTQRRPDITDEHRRRIRNAVLGLTQPPAMRAVTTALRVHLPGQPEYEACRRLLDTLGEYPIASILEILAEERDMTARKALVDLLSGMAEDHIDLFGDRVGDARWYFVRNVVSILSATRSPQALPYLGRTLHHADARVRRETIRALTMIRTALSDEMLVGALSDDDAGNVQLAARHIGTLKLRVGAPALEAVARGEGRGNRDLETRIDAIEALGRIGAPESVGVLEGIARQRSLRASRTRELRTAAERALATLRATGGGGGRG